MVDQNTASWNHVGARLSRIEGLKATAKAGFEAPFTRCLKSMVLVPRTRFIVEVPGREGAPRVRAGRG
jgi:hypothetical protein